MTYPFMTSMQGKANARFVAIPDVVSRAAKGRTRYDDWFNHMREEGEAIQIPEDEFDKMRKAAFRYLEFNKLISTVSVRQRKDARTKTYVIWFADKSRIENNE